MHLGLRPKFEVGMRLTVHDYDIIKEYGKFLPMIGTVDAARERKDGNIHRGWDYYLKPDSISVRRELIRQMENQLTAVQILVGGRPRSMTPRFKVGMRATLCRQSEIESYRGIYPLVGWIEDLEEVRANGAHRSWKYGLRSDLETEKRELVWWDELQLTRVHLTRFGRPLRNSHSALCPWCNEHGHDPRWTTWTEGAIHPDIPECKCWWHEHDTHMILCPNRKGA